MRRVFAVICSFIFFVSMLHSVVFAEQPPSEAFTPPDIQYVRARVVTVDKAYTKIVNGYPNTYQHISFTILEGKKKNETLTVEVNTQINSNFKERLQPGEAVVLTIEQGSDGKEHITVADRFRLNRMWYLVFVFVFFIVLMTGKKGVGAIAGLIISLGIILFYIIPQILNQQDPLQISITGACMILFTSTFLAHGVSKKTTIAVVATFISLCITYLLGILFVSFAHLAGLGTEDSYMLAVSSHHSINAKGLLLGGIIIGTLGALNDITTTQVAAIFALVKANPKQSFGRLIGHGLSIGREHILSLVNTLVLAYAGSSLPVFVFLIINPQQLPYWTILNSESMSEEIVRSLVSSLGLMAAVPIATLLAAYVALRLRVKS